MELRPGYKQTEIGVIPEDWEVIQLGDLSEFVTSGSRGWARYYTEAGARFIRSQNVRDGRLDFSDTQCVSPPSGTEGNRTRLTQGDLLVTITGNSVGNVAWVDRDLGEAYISQHVGLIRLLERGLAPYLCLYFTPGSPGNLQIWKSQAGQSKPGLNLQNLRDFVVLLPPTLAEQTAIAEALSDADGLIEALERLIAKKRQIKQGAMQDLLTARRRLPGFTGEWEVKRLGEVAEIRSGGTPSTAQDQFWNGDILWCTPTDITALEGFKYLVGTARTITRLGLESSSAEIIPSRSIIMTSRATIGECAINLFPVTTNQGFKNFVAHHNFDTEFLYYLLSVQKQRFIALCGGSTFLEIGKVQLERFAVRLPSALPEQTAIAAVLSDMDAELAALEAKLAKARAVKQGMMHNLLTGKIRLI